MRRIKKLAAVFLSAMLFSGCANNPPQHEPEPYVPTLTPAYEDGCITPPFWVVKDEDTGAQIFLMGSMHAGTEDVKYPEYVLRAYHSSSYIAAEMDTVAFGGDISQKRKCSGYIKLQNGSASDHIGSDYDRTVEFFKQRGIYQTGMEQMIPYYWASAATGLVLRQSGLNSEFGSENVLLNLAHSDGKKIREIEGGEAQYKTMQEIPMSVQLSLLKDCVGDDNIAFQAKTTLELYEAWCSFNEEYFRGISVFDEDAVENPDDWQKYYKMMYTDRQQIMADFIFDSLKAGEKGFVFVGTLHFYAEPSILTLLGEFGYSVEAIRPEQNSEESAAA